MTSTITKTMADPTDEQDETPKSTQPRRKRGPRRATVPGTGPASADGPEPRLEKTQGKDKKRKQQPLSERERWMLDEKPPHY